MPPETGNLKNASFQLPVSGQIKISILMPPETGNLKMPHFNYSPLFLGGNMSSQPQPGAN